MPLMIGIKLGKLLFWCFALLIGHRASLAQDRRSEWFAESCLFPMLQYDLLEVQPFAGVFYLTGTGQYPDAAYIPVNLGFRKSIFKHKIGSTDFEMALGAASYTQFEMIRDDKSTLRGGLLNTDFKASGFLQALNDRHAFRLQIFHISSHLGDDYILRNQAYELNDKSVNYEQLDLTYLYEMLWADIYAGIGYVITPNAFRRRLMLEMGLQGNYELRPSLAVAYGADIKIYNENDFSPDIHAGIGVVFKQRNVPQISFLIDIYTGKLPYSTLDFGSIFWIGPSCKVHL
jgi:hypothetical protein